MNLLDFGRGTHGLVAEVMKKNPLSFVHAAGFRNVCFASLPGLVFFQQGWPFPDYNLMD